MIAAVLQYQPRKYRN